MVKSETEVIIIIIISSSILELDC